VSSTARGFDGIRAALLATSLVLFGVSAWLLAPISLKTSLGILAGCGSGGFYAFYLMLGPRHQQYKG
jgi:hypothetical protein